MSTPELWVRRLLLRLAVGRRTYDYMYKTLAYDPRLRTCHFADIVVRKDGRDERIEADWLKNLYELQMGHWVRSHKISTSNKSLVTEMGDETS
jgi:hypothetical protein